MPHHNPPEDSRDPVPTMRDLYPDLSDEELIEAEENLKRYVRAVSSIYDRIAAEPGGKERLEAG